MPQPVSPILYTDHKELIQLDLCTFPCPEIKDENFNLPKTNLCWKKLPLLYSHAIIISPEAGQGGMHTAGMGKAQTLLPTRQKS